MRPTYLPDPTLERRAFLLGLSSTVLLAGCASDPKVLRVGSQRGANKVWMQASGALSGTAYQVEWSEFPAAQHLLEAIGAGAVDLGVVGDAPFLFAYENGSPVVAVQATRNVQHNAGTALLVRKGSAFHTVADLRSKRIATGRGSIGHELLLRALRHAKLRPADVEIVFFAPGDAKAAFDTGAIDAWSTWNPYVGSAILHGDARVVADGRDFRAAVSFMAANRQAAAEKHAAIADFLARNMRGQEWTIANKDAFAALLAKETGLPLDVARYTADRDFRTVPMDARMRDDLQDVLALYASAGATQGTRPIEQALDPSFDRPGTG